jgi:hypothetical protein
MRFVHPSTCIEPGAGVLGVGRILAGPFGKPEHDLIGIEMCVHQDCSLLAGVNQGCTASDQSARCHPRTRTLLQNNRNVGRVFTSRKDHHWGRQKLARDR